MTIDDRCGWDGFDCANANCTSPWSCPYGTKFEIVGVVEKGPKKASMSNPEEAAAEAMDRLEHSYWINYLKDDSPNLGYVAGNVSVRDLVTVYKYANALAAHGTIHLMVDACVAIESLLYPELADKRCDPADVNARLLAWIDHFTTGALEREQPAGEPDLVFDRPATQPSDPDTWGESTAAYLAAHDTSAPPADQPVGEPEPPAVEEPMPACSCGGIQTDYGVAHRGTCRIMQWHDLQIVLNLRLECAALRDECERLRKDAERLDWLGSRDAVRVNQGGEIFWVSGLAAQGSIREEIDAAKESQ